MWLVCVCGGGRDGKGGCLVHGAGKDGAIFFNNGECTGVFWISLHHALYLPGDLGPPCEQEELDTRPGGAEILANDQQAAG